MTFYAQTSQPWATNLLGWNTDPNWDLANQGCLVTAWGNLLVATTGDESWTPVKVNDWMKANGGFVAGGGLFIFSEALGMGGVTYLGMDGSVSAVNSWLKDPPNFAIIEVRTASGGQHFVLGTAVNTIIDSEDGRLKKLGTYKFVQAHLYTAISLPVQQEAPVAPPVTSGPLNATATINVPILNARALPTTQSPVMATAHAGTIHVSEWTIGETVTVNGRTDNVWLKTDAGHFVAQAGTTLKE